MGVTPKNDVQRKTPLLKTRMPTIASSHANHKPFFHYTAYQTMPLPPLYITLCSTIYIPTAYQFRYPKFPSSHPLQPPSFPPPTLTKGRFSLFGHCCHVLESPHSPTLQHHSTKTLQCSIKTPKTTLTYQRFLLSTYSTTS